MQILKTELILISEEACVGKTIEKTLRNYQTKFIKCEGYLVYNAELIKPEIASKTIPEDAVVLTIATDGKGLEGIAQHFCNYNLSHKTNLKTVELNKVRYIRDNKIIHLFKFEDFGITLNDVISEIACQSSRTTNVKRLTTHIIASFDGRYHSSHEIVPEFEEFAIPNCEKVQYYEFSEGMFLENSYMFRVTAVIVTNGEKTTGVFFTHNASCKSELANIKAIATFHLCSDSHLSSILCVNDPKLVLDAESELIDYVERKCEAATAPTAITPQNSFFHFAISEKLYPELDYCLIDPSLLVYDYEKMQEQHKSKLGNNLHSVIVLRRDNKIVGYDSHTSQLSDEEVRTFLLDRFDNSYHGTFYYENKHGVGRMENVLTGKLMEHMAEDRVDLLNPYIGRYVEVCKRDEIKQVGTLFVLASDTTQGIFLPREEVRKLCGTHFGKNLVWHKQMKESVLESFAYPSTRNLVGLALDQKNVFIVPIKERIEIQPRTDVSLAGGFFRV